MFNDDSAISQGKKRARTHRGGPAIVSIDTVLICQSLDNLSIAAKNILFGTYKQLALVCMRWTLAVTPRRGSVSFRPILNIYQRWDDVIV